MSNPDSPRQLAEPAAQYLVSLMWHPHGATWYEVQRWFVRMWSSGDPGTEEEIRSGVEAAVKALTYRPQRAGDTPALLPRELAEHWTALIAAALEEQRFSPQALAAFMEEFHVPAKLGAQMIATDLKARALERRGEELADQNSVMWNSLREVGKERSREDRNNLSDHLQQRHQANQADQALRREASSAYSKARSDLRSAEHRLSVLEQQHAAGRRTDAELDEARENQQAATERMERTKGELDRVDNENAQRKEQRRQEPRAMDEHRRDYEDVQLASAALRSEISELKAEKLNLEAKSRELRAAYRRQDDFYEQKRDAARRREQEQRDLEWHRRRQAERDRNTTKAEKLRDQALNPPSSAPQAPQSPEVRDWLHHQASLEGWADVAPPGPSREDPPQPETPPTTDPTESAAPDQHGPDTPPPPEHPIAPTPPTPEQVPPPFVPPPSQPTPGPAPEPTPEAAPEPPASDDGGDAAVASPSTDGAGDGSESGVEEGGSDLEHLMNVAPVLSKAMTRMSEEVARFRELPETTGAADLSTTSQRIKDAHRQVASLHAEFAAIHQKQNKNAAELQKAVDASLDQLHRIMRNASGIAGDHFGLEDVERMRHMHAFQDPQEEQLQRSLAATRDVLQTYEVLSAAAEQLAQAKSAVESAQDVLRQARERNDIDEITVAAELLRRARAAYGNAEMESATALARLDKAEQTSARISDEMTREAADRSAAPEFDPDEFLRNLQDPPTDEDGPDTP